MNEELTSLLYSVMVACLTVLLILVDFVMRCDTAKQLVDSTILCDLFDLSLHVIGGKR